LITVGLLSTVIWDWSSSLSLSPGLNAGKPLYGHVAHRNESPRKHLPHPEISLPSFTEFTNYTLDGSDLYNMLIILLFFSTTCTICTCSYFIITSSSWWFI
jgi:hypothetical protein